MPSRNKMATIQGSPNPTALEYIEVSRGYENSGNGRVVTLVFRGSKDALRIASAQWVALGARYQIREDGPYSEATVTIGGNNFDPGTPISEQSAPLPNEIAPDIRFEFRTDYVDVSVFALPAVARDATASGNPAAYRYTLETAVKNGDSLPAGASSMQQKVWQKLSRGEESFPVARISLTRIASFPGNLGLPQIPNGIPPVYRPLQFIAVWNLPFSVQQMLPPIPVDPITGQVQAPSGTEWGWKQTNYSTNLITKTNQVEQVISWTFAPYDLDIYPFF
jgi:hypothetical protein